jgi:hypothetical protein
LFGRALLLCALGLLACACATIHNPLSQQDIAALRIVEVAVTFKPDANISWSAAEQEYVAEATARNPKLRLKSKAFEHSVDTGAGPDTEAGERYKLIASPEGREYVRKKTVGLIDKHLKRDIVPRLQGTRDARLEVTVFAFLVPDAVQRATLGGTPMLLALTTLKDARTGAELAKLDQGASTYAGQGIVGALVDQAVAAPLEERLVDSYVSNVRNWLLKTS